MSPEVKKMVGQAVVQLLNGDINLFHSWTARSCAEYKRQQIEDRLHASISDILKSKGKAV